MRRLVALLAVVTFVAAASPARSQNDWQFPDPYFGALEFDASRPAVTRPSRAAPATASRSKPPRQRAHRGRPRWIQQGARP